MKSPGCKFCVAFLPGAFSLMRGKEERHGELGVLVPGLAGVLGAGVAVAGLPQSLSQNIVTKTVVGSPRPRSGHGRDPA